jgi:hypothetical protein
MSCRTTRLPELQASGSKTRTISSAKLTPVLGSDCHFTSCRPGEEADMFLLSMRITTQILFIEN